MDLPLMPKRIVSLPFSAEVQAKISPETRDISWATSKIGVHDEMWDTGHRLSRRSWCSTYSVSVAFPTSCTGRNCCDVSGFTSLVREDFVASLSRPQVRGESVPHRKINSRNRCGIGKSSTNWWVHIIMLAQSTISYPLKPQRNPGQPSSSSWSYRKWGHHLSPSHIELAIPWNLI